MTHTRLLVKQSLRPGVELELDRGQARYVGRVLRLRVGDVLHVFNGDDGEFTASIRKIGKTSAVLQVEAELATATESPLKVHLVQGISRGERMDFVVQKATELGAKRITPVFTGYGVVRLDAQRARKRRDHWQGIADSACEQCGRIRPPLIDDPLPLDTWFGARPADADLDLILQPRAATALQSVRAPQTKVCLLVGPEGGFGDSEYDAALLAGFKAVSLGPRILRTETAATAAIAVVQSLWGDLGAGRAAVDARAN